MHRYRIVNSLSAILDQVGTACNRPLGVIVPLMFLQDPYFSAEGALGLPKAKSWWEHCNPRFITWPGGIIQLTNWCQFFMRLSCCWSWTSSLHCHSSLTMKIIQWACKNFCSYCKSGYWLKHLDLRHLAALSMCTWCYYIIGWYIL